jgi:hypothetical protein
LPANPTNEGSEAGSLADWGLNEIVWSQLILYLVVNNPGQEELARKNDYFVCIESQRSELGLMIHPNLDKGLRL